MNKREIHSIISPNDITGMIPGVKGQRAFPTQAFKDSDPFLMLDQIGPEKVGKDWKLDGEGHDHPHRGFETITFMFEGQMDHRDSLGNREKLNSGDIQRMNAGSGIIHGGSMASNSKTERFHELQLWINNPASEKMSVPEVHNEKSDEIPCLNFGSNKLRVISGILNEVEGPVRTKASTQIGHLVFKNSGSLTIGEFDKTDQVMLYVLEGELLVNNQPVGGSELVQFTDEGRVIEISSDGEAQALILAGNRLNEPVAFGGPFVMNTEEEISKAYADFKLGLFGEINNTNK